MPRLEQLAELTGQFTSLIRRRWHPPIRSLFCLGRRSTKHNITQLNTTQHNTTPLNTA